ncbi:hypothetical protein JCM24511_06666 [Saitozyma sp. JCM 24511]|nr:hypothetical protein JCM24511_06666 [Saitozyma sp. JCM 24511]
MIVQRLFRLHRQREEQEGVRAGDETARAEWQEFGSRKLVSGHKSRRAGIVAHRARLTPGGKMSVAGRDGSMARSFESTPHAFRGPRRRLEVVDAGVEPVDTRDVGEMNRFRFNGQQERSDSSGIGEPWGSDIAQELVHPRLVAGVR